jgi:hypothetical protein
MKSNIAFIDKTMERAGQYSSRQGAKIYADTTKDRKHKIVSAICYRMDGRDQRGL